MDNLPDVIRIEPVGLCNFNCQHCPTGVSPNKRALLSKDKFHEIIDGFKKINFLPRVVVCYHGGEPLLNKNLTYFIKYLKDWGVKKTVITTNASLLTEQKSIELIEAGSSLKLCRVAEGEADIYCRMGPTYQWDIAAGQAVAEAAGGALKTLDGNDFFYTFDSEKKNPEFYCVGDSSFAWKTLFS